MKIAFLGTGRFAVQSLSALLEAGHRPVLVVTRPPRRRRRRSGEEPTPVGRAAAAAGIDVFCPEKVNRPESLERLHSCGADLHVVCQFGALLSQRLLDIPPLGAINVHASLLPRWRGASPVHAAIRAGDAETGISIQRVVKELDAGPVYASQALPIADDDDTGTLTEKLAALGGRVLVGVVDALAAGSAAEPTPQDPAAVTYAGRITPADARIDWGLPAREVWLHLRAMSPKPGAGTTLLRDPPLEVQVARGAVEGGDGAPGQVVRAERAGLWVACGEGALRIDALKPAGRRQMTAQDFLNGYRLQVGELFQVRSASPPTDLS